MPLTDPALQRRKLRDSLRRLREGAGFTQRDVAEEMEWSLSKMIRIETGRIGISITDLKALIAHYRVADQGEADRLVGMARAARERPWWDRFKGVVDPAFLLFLGYEGFASIIRTFEPVVVPGMLQTEEYALEVLRVTSPPEVVEARTELRLERQERVLRPDGPQLHFILDENVITRIVGGPSVMRRQLRHLKELTDHPKISLRILPYTAGLYPSCLVPYVLFEFDDPEEDVVLYLEGLNEQMVREGRDWVDEKSPARFLESFFSNEQLAPRNAAPVLLDQSLSRLAQLRNLGAGLSDGVGVGIPADSDGGQGQGASAPL